MKAGSLFQNRKALLVTRHSKEKVISPLLMQELGLEVTIATRIDTDQFGTFSGEVERPDNQYNTARLKVMKAFEWYPEMEIVIASEGAFNPHPDCPFIPVNTELVLLIDKKNFLEVAGRYLTLAPGVKEATVSDMQKAREFAENIGFPEYGVILKAGRNNDTNKPIILKEVTTWPDLEDALRHLFSLSMDGSVSMQTDMRAHRNPFRMENIRQATLELIKVIRSVCSRCNTPGFDVKEVTRGLPCSLCGAPTKTVLSYIYECKKCQHREERFFPHNKQQEDPGFCDCCNP